MTLWCDCFHFRIVSPASFTGTLQLHALDVCRATDTFDLFLLILIGNNSTMHSQKVQI